MIDAVLRMLSLRCPHKRLTRPITPLDERRRASRQGTYVVCLDCGTQLPYDWENMRVGRPAGPLKGHELEPELAKHANSNG
jgi:hypothetical protein